MYSVDYSLDTETDKVKSATLKHFIASSEAYITLAKCGGIRQETGSNHIKRSVLLYDKVAAWVLYRGLKKTIPGCGGWETTHVLFGDFLTNGKIEVMLLEKNTEWHRHLPDGFEFGGPAYTSNAWLYVHVPEFECINGKWRVLGLPGGIIAGELFPGKVVSVDDAANEAALLLISKRED